MKRNGIIEFEATGPITVEMDTAVRAAYVRLSTNKVAKTQPLMTVDCIITRDVDADGKTVGIELVGVDDYTIQSLLRKAGFRIGPEHTFQDTRYVAADLQTA